MTISIHIAHESMGHLVAFPIGAELTHMFAFGYGSILLNLFGCFVYLFFIHLRLGWWQAGLEGPRLKQIGSSPNDLSFSFRLDYFLLRRETGTMSDNRSVQCTEAQPQSSTPPLQTHFKVKEITGPVQMQSVEKQ